MCFYCRFRPVHLELLVSVLDSLVVWFRLLLWVGYFRGLGVFVGFGGFPGFASFGSSVRTL